MDRSKEEPETWCIPAGFLLSSRDVEGPLDADGWIVTICFISLLLNGCIFRRVVALNV